MNDISIPQHLAIPTLICFIGLFTILVFRKKLFAKDKLLWGSITAFIVVYCFIVSSATFYDIYYQWDLNRYDLDQDGFFGGAEITCEQQEAMRKLTNDTGRNFSFITGFVFAAMVAGVVYILGLLSRYIFKLKA